MADHAASSNSSPASRREFLKASSVAIGTLAGGLAIGRSAHAAGGDTLKLGLIGCGGRGSGAAMNALTADANVKLTAMADMFPDRLQGGLNNIKGSLGAAAEARMHVPVENQFTGFEAYQKLLASGVDVVILATPPHFRPAHLKAAIEAGKHVFCEKPVAVDAPGVRSVLATAEEAKKKNLSIVSGLCYRYHPPKQETIHRIHDGAIGDVEAMHVSYNTGTLWHHARRPEWSDMEFQLRNWLYFTWLSGDFNVEQHIHSLDKAAWVMKDEPPLKATGLGGRQVRVEEQWGNVYDHFAVVYEYANGTRLFANCRQMAGCSTDVSDHIFGSKGKAELMSARIDAEQPWKYRGPEANMYDLEHQQLFAGIRSGNPINNGLYMARSTMLAIMGRMAAYTGQTLTWEQCLTSKEDLTPAKYELGPLPVARVAMPGLTKFV